MFDFIVIHLFCLNRVEESGGPVRKERLLVSCGGGGKDCQSLSRETCRSSAEPGSARRSWWQQWPEGQGDGPQLATAQKMSEVTKTKSGSNAFKDSEKRSGVATFYIYSVFPRHFELCLLKKLTILVRILIKPGVFKVSKSFDLLWGSHWCELLSLCSVTWT